MSEKHYPYIGGSFDRIVFDGDGSVWVPESENAKLQDENARLRSCLSDDAENARQIMAENFKMRELCTDMHAWMGRALYENSARKHEYESITDCMDNLGVPHD